MNEDVYKMIDTLHARLDDVRGAVDKLSGEAPEYVGKLDKIDDKLYLLQCEIEKVAAHAQQDSSNSDDEQKTSSSEASFADSSDVATNGTEVITELSGTMGDLKDIFSFGKKR